MTCDGRNAAFGGKTMVRRAFVSSGESQLLVDRLRWHIQQALHCNGMSAALALYPLAQSTSEGRSVVTFDPVVERIRMLIRTGDVVEVNAAEGVGIVLHGADIAGARAVFMRLKDALCSPIPPRAGDEVAVPVALGYAASSTFASGTPRDVAMRSAAPADADGAMAGAVEAVSAAMLDAAWMPRTVLMLTLPVLECAAQPVRHTRAHPWRNTEDELALTSGGMQAQANEPLVPEHADPASNVSDADEVAAQQHAMQQRGHLRLVASQHVTLPEIEALRSLAQTMGVPFVRIPSHLSRSCRSLLHPAVACELRAVPIGRTRGTLTVAMHDPTDAQALRRLQTLIGLSIFPVLAAPDEIDRALRQLMSTMRAWR